MHLDVDEVLYRRVGHNPGDTGYYFLLATDKTGVYGFALMTYGRVMVTDGTAHLAETSGTEDEGPWAAANAEFDDLDGLEQIIDQTVADAESGKAQPAEPITG